MRTTHTLERRSTSGVDIFDLTDDLRKLVAESGISEGEALVFVPGSTAALTTIEHEPGVLEDLKAALERMAPSDIRYAHDAAWGDGNGFSHVRAALVGPSLVVPIAGSHLILGTWQQVVLLDFDNRGRLRRILVRLTGERD